MSGSQIQAFAGTFENGGSSQWRHELLDYKQIKPYSQPLYAVGVTALTSHSILYLSYRVSFTLPNVACFAIRIRCVFALTFTFLNNFVLSSLIFENFREVANKLINCCKRAQYWVYSTTLTHKLALQSTRFLFQYKIHVYSWMWFCIWDCVRFERHLDRASKKSRWSQSTKLEFICFKLWMPNKYTFIHNRHSCEMPNHMPLLLSSSSFGVFNFMKPMKFPRNVSKN